MGNGYIVCFADEGKKNPVTLGPVVQYCTGMTRPDARRAVLKGHGLVADGLSQNQANGLVNALRDQGAEAFVVTEATVPRIGDVVRLHRVALAPEGLQMTVSMRERPIGVPWTALVAAVATQPELKQQSSGSHTYKDAVFVPGGGMVTVTKRESRRPQRREGPTATIALKNARGEVRAFEFNQQSADYGFLGGHMAPTQAANFGRFLQELARRAPHAYFTSGYLALAGGNRRDVSRVSGRAERLDYLRWALCCAARDE